LNGKCRKFIKKEGRRRKEKQTEVLRNWCVRITLIREGLRWVMVV
jgi:hypothetical protein